MSDRPILFSAPMVRALLAGTKTQTRRALKRQPEQNSAGLFVLDGPNGFSQAKATDVPSSYETLGLVRIAGGDRLWVRECWRTIIHVDGLAPREISASRPIFYEADNRPPEGRGKIRASIHMPRWASRLTLAVTEIRVQRLQDISEEDAIAEGPGFVGKISGEVCESVAAHRLGGPRWRNARDWYADLWDSINGAGAWDANPWVVAVSFTASARNIDAAAPC